MKKLIALPFLVFLALPVFAQSRVVDGPMLEEEYIEVEETTYGADGRRIEAERMEDLERDRYEDHRYGDNIDYTDRTRTNRERKAINTSSNASDDK